MTNITELMKLVDAYASAEGDYVKIDFPLVDDCIERTNARAAVVTALEALVQPAPAPLELTSEEIAAVQASDPAYTTCSCPAFACAILDAANAKRGAA